MKAEETQNWDTRDEGEEKEETQSNNNRKVEVKSMRHIFFL